MITQCIIALIVLGNLRKQLKKLGLLAKWTYLLLAGAVIFVALIVLYSVIENGRQVLTLLSHASSAVLVFLILTQKDFRASKSFLYAFLPFMIVYFIQDSVAIISAAFYKKWDNLFEAAEAFAFFWMIAMLVVNNRQNKALEKARLKAEEKEKEYRITEKLKAELEVQVKERTAQLTNQKEELQQALNELKATQNQLIQSEKMASLGELTAGIAHEIQNPLNFVNNFSDLNKELLEELKEEAEKGNLDEVKAIANDLIGNEQKINHHGKRADAIVKGMLQHSRSSSSIKEPTDINALADEYLRLSYHGLRAKDKSFNAAFKTEFEPGIGKIALVPQDIGRVILNLFNNAFYSVNEKKKQLNGTFQPVVCITTKRVASASDREFGSIELIIKDNGNGIPQKIVDKIFQPFFTTKPTGQGTGLGLSLSYDIIKAHGGELKVETKEGEFAEFIISLPG